MKKILVIDLRKDVNKTLTLKEFEEEYGQLPFEHPEKIYKIKVFSNALNVYTKHYGIQNIYECDKVFGSWRYNLFIGRNKLSKEDWEYELKF